MNSEEKTKKRTVLKKKLILGGAAMILFASFLWAVWLVLWLGVAPGELLGFWCMFVLFQVVLLLSLWVGLNRWLFRPLRALARSNTMVAQGNLGAAIISDENILQGEIGTLMRSHSMVLDSLISDQMQLEQELTEKELVEETLQEKMHLNQTLLDALPCIALLIRPQTREIVASNEAAAQVGAVPGKKCFATWRLREDPCPWCLAPALWATGAAQHIEEVEGLGSVLDTYWIPVEPDLYMHYAFDVTDRKEIEQKFIRLEHLRALGEITTGISHNLIDSLTAVQLSAEQISMLTDSPDILRLVEIITTAEKEAVDLVRRLNQATRQKSDREPMMSVTVNKVIQEAVEEMLTRWEDEPETRGVSVEVVTDTGDGPSVLGVQQELHEIFIGLLSNAADAMPEGGTITIRTQAVEDGVQVTVSDTGIGMDSETRRRVFEPFFTTKKDVGSGLGLSTVYGAVTRWGGDIKVESEPGEGTIFTILLPAWTE